MNVPDPAWKSFKTSHSFPLEFPFAMESTLLANPYPEAEAIPINMILSRR
jgi:hypothetical protein